MKKFILLVSTVFFSLLFVNNKAYAQEYPDFLKKLDYFGAEYDDDEYTNTYEYSVYYLIDSTIDPTTISESDYYLVTNLKVPIRKGTHRDMFSYEVIDILAGPSFTRFQVRITLLKTFVHQNYSSPYDLITSTFFQDNMAFYVRHITDYQEGYNDGYYDGYIDGYNDGYNDFNVADYFGERNIAKANDIEYYLVSDAFEPSTSIVIYNVGRAEPNILLDKPNIIVIIKKNIYDYVVVRFANAIIYHFDATYFDIGDFDIYIFNLPGRVNTKYNLEIRKLNVTTSEEANRFLNDVVGNIYFSHAPKLMNSDQALKFYEIGYITGLEEVVSDNDAYHMGYRNGYNYGYINGEEAGYERGFEEGYEQGFDDGKTLEYEDGYNDGYNIGYDDGLNASTSKFTSNLHVWIVPAMIVVIVAGIFVGYRRERHWND